VSSSSKAQGQYLTIEYVIGFVSDSFAGTGPRPGQVVHDLSMSSDSEGDCGETCTALSMIFTDCKFKIKIM
jgi:hypothetical protein